MRTEELTFDVSEDWIQACGVQERFMRQPKPKSGVLDIAVRCRQLQALGGDCYDFTWMGDGRLAFLIGDASGKGAAAALMMAGVQASLRTASLFTGDDLPALLRAANLQVWISSLSARYATIICAVLHPTARTLRYVNAGHNPALILHADGAVERLEPTGPPIGLFRNANWQERVLHLHAGDCILAHTDGVTEACNANGEEWGEGGLVQAAQGCDGLAAAGVVDFILGEMDRFSNDVHADDATLAVMRLL